MSTKAQQVCDAVLAGDVGALAEAHPRTRNRALKLLADRPMTDVVSSPMVSLGGHAGYVQHFDENPKLTMVELFDPEYETKRAVVDTDRARRVVLKAFANAEREADESGIQFLDTQEAQVYLRAAEALVEGADEDRPVLQLERFVRGSI